MQKPIENGSMHAEIISAASISDLLSFKEKANKGKLDLDVLHEFLGSLLPEEGQATRDQVSGILGAISQPQKLNKILESILTDPEQLAKVARRSFGHSLGMERIDLASNGQWSLRLHFWMPGKQEYTEDPHNHSYNFGSKVLSGILVADLFALGKDGVDMNMYEIASQTTLQKPKPELIGETGLQIISPPEGIVLSDSDTAYAMSHRIIHRIRQGDTQSPIITLNLRGGAVKDRSTFFRDDKMPSANPAPTQVDVESRLNLLHNKLAQT